MPASKKKPQVVPLAEPANSDAEVVVPLLIPKHLAGLATEARPSYKSPVEIETYVKFRVALLKRLQKDKCILVADLDEFSRFAGEAGWLTNGLEKPGKMLLMTDREDFANIPFAAERGFEVIAKQVPAGQWTYKVNKFIEEIKFDNQIDYLREEDLKKRRDLDSLNEIGAALSTEHDLNSLLDLIVSKSREMTAADAGSLYLIEADPDAPEDEHDYFKNKKMRFVVAQTESRNVPFKSIQMDISKSSIVGYVGLTQEALNFQDVYYLDPTKEFSWGGRDFDAIINYRTMSMLTVPMVNYRAESIGVLQLINRKKDPKTQLGEPDTFVEHIQPFTEHDVAIAMSIASQASIAIQNTQLVNSIKGLFNGFIAASVKAIESRDPTTSGHSQRVADLTVTLAKHVARSKKSALKNVSFSEEALQEIRYASLLHDFGKIGVRENVLVKAKKLFPYELQAVRDRFDLIRRTVEADHTRKQLQVFTKLGSTDKALARVQDLDKQRQEELEEVNDFLNFVLQCNEPTVLAQGGFERLHDVAKKIFRNWDGEKIPFISERELISLSVARGSLNENDRKEIESHVTHTYKFLTTIPWTPDLRHVPEIAYAHHEKLDGTGYPNKLNAKQIPIQAKMMSISDIFDALTASDRPYKKAMPAERALNILQEESKAKHVDEVLLNIFIESECYKLVL